MSEADHRYFLKGCDTMLVLSGILVMVIGLMLRFNALLVVVAAGFATGLYLIIYFDFACNWYYGTSWFA